MKMIILFGIVFAFLLTVLVARVSYAQSPTTSSNVTNTPTPTVKVPAQAPNTGFGGR